MYQQQRGQLQTAAQGYRQALAAAPDSATVMNNYGAFLCTLGQYVAAQQQFNAAASRSDEDGLPAHFSAQEAASCMPPVPMRRVDFSSVR
ncbi:Flp pilus assembly protein TadD, contains TPR repeats [Edwardsiella tarda]|nr:Flp pilus assembly protein TadD, contains TPR repeats [Edwardsiella tarda]